MKTLHATTDHALVSIFLDGKDVSTLAFYAEGADQPGKEARGKVSLYRRDEQGRIVKDQNGMPVIEHKEGRVRWEFTVLGWVREQSRTEQ